MIDPFFYEHAARGDIEFKIWIEKISIGYVWDFISGVVVDEAAREFMLELSDTRHADLQKFWAECVARIDSKPNEAFRMAFR